MTFQQVREFFENWGMYPQNESCGDLNKEVIDQGINRKCFEKMLLEAKETYGTEFYTFVSTVIDAQDDAYYMRCKTWIELNISWTSVGW